MTTITKYTTEIPDSSTVGSTVNITSTSQSLDQTIVPSAVPTFATNHCSDSGQFSSACACWANATASTITLPVPTVTATQTEYADVSCSPAVTAIGPDAESAFPCSRRWGTCSCLRSGDDEVCVRVGPFLGAGGNMTSGPCSSARECDVDGECEKGYICIFDGSCGCGKRRCYRAAPRGCEYQGVPIEEFSAEMIHEG